MGDNSRQPLKDNLRRLIEYYRATDPRLNVTSEYQSQWLHSMSRFDDDAVDKTVAHFKEWVDRFPTVHQCVVVADSIQQNIDLANKPKPVKPQWQENDEFAKKAFKLIQGILSADLTRKEYLEGCEAMGMDMASLRQYYAQHDMSIDLRPKTKRRPSQCV